KSSDIQAIVRAEDFRNPLQDFELEIGAKVSRRIGFRLIFLPSQIPQILVPKLLENRLILILQIQEGLIQEPFEFHGVDFRFVQGLERDESFPQPMSSEMIGRLRPAQKLHNFL
ncbi:unnamed protein product, partial [Linum tenue]